MARVNQAGGNRRALIRGPVPSTRPAARSSFPFSTPRSRPPTARRRKRSLALWMRIEPGRSIEGQGDVIGRSIWPRLGLFFQFLISVVFIELWR